jgi:hypothetical protein
MSSLRDCPHVTCDDSRQSWTHQFDWLLAHASIITWRHSWAIVTGYWLQRELNTNSTHLSYVVCTAVHRHISPTSFDQLCLLVGDLARCLSTCREHTHYLVTEPSASPVHAPGIVYHCMFALPSPYWLLYKTAKISLISVCLPVTSLSVCMFSVYFIYQFVRRLWSMFCVGHLNLVFITLHYLTLHIISISRPSDSSTC